MSEAEKLRLAKAYIDKLADGIDPISGRPVPESDVINDVRVSRCLFFVSETLGKLLGQCDARRPEKQKKAAKKQPSISFEKRGQFAYSSMPITASDIASRINKLIDEENEQKISYLMIATWLTEIGMLEWRKDAQGKWRRRPTKQAVENGITVSGRSGKDGSYTVVVYSDEAQSFIVDNIDSVIAAENGSAVNAGKPWTAEEDAQLREMFLDGKTAGETARRLGRNTSAVDRRRRRLGIDPK